jgi:hypothetical protein
MYPKTGRDASANARAENRPGPREGIKAKGSHFPYTVKVNGEPVALCDAEREQLALLYQLFREEYGDDIDLSGDYRLAVTRPQEPPFPVLDGCQWFPRYRKAVLHVAPIPENTAGVHASACLRLVQRSWPGATVILVRVAGRALGCLRRYGAEWRSIPAGHADYLF